MLGEKITIQEGRLHVPSQPIIPFIEGDGIGPDIWAAAVRVIDAAVEKAYNGERKIIWKEVYAGEKANEKTGSYLPEETLEAMKEHLVGIKGPLTTPVGGGFRSLNVALRQKLDLFACVRPVRWFNGVPSPVKKPQDVDMVIFRENTEDIYAGIEYKHGTPEVEQVKDFLINEMGVSEIRFPRTASIGIKPVSKEGTERLIKAALDYTIEKGRKSLTIVHKGNIMKFTEGMFKQWAYDFCEVNYGDKVWTWQQYDAVKAAQGTEAADAAQKTALDNGAILIKDSIADAFLQQILLRPTEYDVIATLNLNGDYISDALAAMVGGIGIAPGANINYNTGIALFEATHGTAPKYAGMDKVNPSSVILSAVMMLDFMGWSEAGDIIEKGIEGAIANKRVTYDFERLMEGATTLKCSEFGTEIIENLGEPVFTQNKVNTAAKISSIVVPIATPVSTPISNESIAEPNEINSDTNEVSLDSQISNSESNIKSNSFESTAESHNENVVLDEVNADSSETISNESNVESTPSNEEVVPETSSETHYSTPEANYENVVLNEVSESTESTIESPESISESSDSNEVITHVVSTIEDSTPVVHNSGELFNEITTASQNLESEKIDSNPIAYDPSTHINDLDSTTESNNTVVDSDELTFDFVDIAPESPDSKPVSENPSVVLLNDLTGDTHDAIAESQESNEEV